MQKVFFGVVKQLLIPIHDEQRCRLILETQTDLVWRNRRPGIEFLQKMLAGELELTRNFVPGMNTDE